MTRLQKILLLVVSGILLALVITTIIISASSHKNSGTAADKVKVQIAVLPVDSSLAVDNQPTVPGILLLTKGTHILKASHQYFGDTQKLIDTQTIDAKRIIYLMPSPDSAESLNYLKKHPDIQTQRERVGGLEAEQRAQAATKTYPILSKLPYETINYKVNSGVDVNNQISFAITITPSFDQKTQPERYQYSIDQAKGDAQIFLQQNGVDVSKANITYTIASGT